jgi:phosphoenolpyruvate---glycerone phosphotransferase subunit DhaL
VTASTLRAGMRSETVSAWMRESAEAVKAERDHLTQLDAAIGDGDHGVNMDRGFDAVTAAFAEEDGSAPPGQLLIVAGKTMVGKVGGASGPLWGTALRRAGRSLGKEPEFDGEALADALAAAIEGVRELGAANPGDKTMLDALMPAEAALRQGIEAGQSLDQALDAAAAAAEEGAQATIPMQARRGRASYLGERSVGHQDPGATSSALIMRALQRAVGNQP